MKWKKVIKAIKLASFELMQKIPTEWEIEMKGMKYDTTRLHLLLYYRYYHKTLTIMKLHCIAWVYETY